MKAAFKRVLAVCISITLLLSLMLVAQAEDAVVFSFDSTIIEADAETAEIVLSIEENPGFAAADIQIVSDLQIIAVQDLGVGAIVNTVSGKANWSSNINKTTTGDILKITFAIPEHAIPGTSWEVSMTVTELVNSNYQAVPYTVQAGTITIDGGERIAGDANRDGSVDLKDVVQIRRWLVGGWNAEINEANADVDGNSTVNLKDVILIRRYLVGDWDVTLQ